RLDGFLSTLQTVVDRHDILRTAVLWDGLAEPVQVVWRRAPLTVEEVELDAADGAIAEQLAQRYDSHNYRLDVRQAPLMRGFISADRANRRWLLQLLSHHMALDHTTLEILIEEIRVIQQGMAAQLPPALPFRNFVAQARLGVSQQEHEAFFAGMLADIDEPTAPYGLLDVQGDGGRIEEIKQELPSDLAARMRAQARGQGVSAASLIHLAWGQVLAKLSGRQQVVFGTVLFGRMQGGVGSDRGLGMFINTLPVRVNVDHKGVAQSVRDTHALLTQLLRHEHASLALAQRCSAVQAPLPLFSSLLNYRHSAVAEEVITEQASAAWDGVEVVSGKERTNFPLTLSVDDLGAGFRLTAQVDRSVSAARVCGYMQAALEGLVAALETAPETGLCTIDPLPAAERQLLLAGWNATQRELAQDLCVHELFEQQVLRTPDTPAVTHDGQVHTYAQLNARANQLARHLRALGVAPEARVAICAGRGLELVVAMLATLKAGGCYVPLDPAYPQERLAYMLADSAPLAVLYDASGRAALAGMAGELPCVELDDAGAQWRDQAGDNLDRLALTADNLAYVIYTSGSTGVPKGVANTGVGLRNRLLWAVRDIFEQAPVTAFKTSIGFVDSVSEVLQTLLAGGTLAVFDHDLGRDVERMAARIAQGDISHLTLVPSLLEALLAADAGALGALKTLVSSGARLSRDLIARTLAACPRVRLYNFYGSSEANGDSTFHACVAADADAVDRSPIGRPIANTQVYILDARRQPVPLGVAGELYIGGAGLARGYLNLPEMTAERFVADPFAGAPEARMYRTGDLARHLADGTIEYLGRNDFQVKIRGVRVELGEIETKLSACADVREAVVLAREDQPGDQRLVAYVVAREGAQLEIAALSEELARGLSDFMVPSAFVVLEALPLTPNGKLDRKALPAPQGQAYVTHGYEAPQGEIEETLAAIWAELLKLERVGRHDNFFQLGGHSLLAVALIERMRRAGVQTDVRTLFGTPTIAALAAGGGAGDVLVPANGIVDGCAAITPDMLPLVQLSQQEIDGIVAAVPGGAANIQDIYPLAPLQEGILFHHMMQGEGDAYLLPTLIEFDTRARLDGFLATLQVVIDRHDILRTAMLWDGLAEPVQVVWRRAPLSVEEVVFDAANGDIAEQLGAAYDPRHYRVDVQVAPLLRAFLCEDRVNGRWLLQLLTHHLAIDHTALDILVEEIRMIQQDRAAELAPALPFRNFVAQARLGVSVAEHEAFFTRMLSDIDEPSAPYGLLDVQGGVAELDDARLTLPHALAETLRAQARTLGVSVASLMHLAWAQVLSKLTGRQDVVFGTVLFGRMQGGSDSGRVLGMFINTLPVRISIGEQGVAGGVRGTHALLTQLLRHEHAPLALAQRCSAVRAPLPLFSSLLNYRHSAVTSAGVDDRENDGGVWDGIEVRAGKERSNYPLTLSVDDLGAGFVLTAQVDRSVSAGRVCAYMQTALEQLAAALEGAPETSLLSLQVLPVAERQQVLAAWNATGTPYARELCVHELFERHAELRPEATALVCGDLEVSYADLNRQANQLARHLRGLGVGADVRVAICSGRGIEMVLAMLATLKAGGCYV
ncbi:non-ribosomal peptide synthetase, partial [Duganella violaceipulchra]